MATSPLEGPALQLAIQQPLDLASSLLSGQAHRWRRDEPTGPGTGADWHWGVIAGHIVKIRQARQEPQGSPDRLEYRFSPEAGPGYFESLFQSYFRLDDDIDSIYREITRDPRVAAMVRRFRGLRLLRLEPWECLVSFICSANSNIPRIHANLEAISVNLGRALCLDGHTRYSFPTPERLAEAGEQLLRTLGLGFRAPYVANAARTVASGDLDLEALRYAPYQDAKERLMELPGIGPKIADCVLLHSLDKLEAFPIDVWVRRALAEWYFQGRKPPPDRVMWEWAQEYFGPYAGYAELYLFHGRRMER